MSREHDVLADYILTWLQERNGGALQDAFDNMRMKDARLMTAELALILEHGGKPPNWVK